MKKSNLAYTHTSCVYLVIFLLLLSVKTVKIKTLRYEKSQHPIKVKIGKFDLILLFFNRRIQKYTSVKNIFEFYKSGILRFLGALNPVSFVTHKQCEEK